MLHVGIIGCGKIAQVRHIPEYAANPRAEIRGYYDLNPARAAEVAARWGGQVYESVEAMLADPAVDAVSVCSANNTHAEYTMQALRAGKHVLCEKPMAVTLAECEQMVAVAEETGKTLMVGLNQRYNAAHRRARQLVQQGVIGDIVSFRSTFGHGGPEGWAIEPGANTWFFDKNKAAMGAMADLGIHKTDLLHFLTDDVVVETTAKVVTVDKRDAAGELIGVDDNAICIYRLSRGAIGTMTASWTFYGPEDNSTVLYGTKGILRIYDNPEFSLDLQLANGERVLYDIDRMQTNDAQTASGVIDSFVDRLDGGEACEVPGSDAIRAMRAVFASIESSNTGCTVSVAQDKEG